MTDTTTQQTFLLSTVMIGEDSEESAFKFEAKGTSTNSKTFYIDGVEIPAEVQPVFNTIKGTPEEIVMRITRQAAMVIASMELDSRKGLPTGAYYQQLSDRIDQLVNSISNK